MPLDFNVIGKRMPMGFPGQVARQSFNIVETHVIDKTNPVTMYGAPVVMTESGTVRAIADGDTSADIYGFTVRPDAVQLGGDNPASFSDSGIPDTAQPVDIMVKGYMNVRVYGDADPTQGAPVYVTPTRQAESEVIPAGAVVASSETADAFAVTGAVFMCGVDEYGISQIRLL